MNVKKIIALVVTALVSAAVFAQGSFVVKSVKGTVKYEEKPGVQKKVTVGQVLSSSTVVNVAMNSTLVLEMDGQEYTVNALAKGALDKVASAKVAGGIKKGGSAAGNVKGDAGTGKSVSTASSRASDAKEDLGWDE